MGTESKEGVNKRTKSKKEKIMKVQANKIGKGRDVKQGTEEILRDMRNKKLGLGKKDSTGNIFSHSVHLLM